MKDIGKLLVILGAVAVVAGLVLWLAGDRLRWLGRLPGDIRIERENFRFYAPITTMLLISVALSLILYLAGKLFR
jgi:H+/Cl- antiporter ClcA